MRLEDVSKDLQTLINQLLNQLQCAGVENPRRELSLLIAFVQNRSYTDVFFEPAISAEDYDRLLPLVQRRCNNEPLSKIVGQREFWSLPFKVTADTLDPRPDSETLILAILDYFPGHDKPLTIIDFGTGTGCLLLSLLSEYPNSSGVAVDISDAALAVAQHNAQKLGLDQRASFVQGNWAKGVQGTFDVLISNPPYIGLNETLEDAVKQYDPHQALYAGEDGLEAYRDLLPQLSRLMHPQSLIFLEIGLGQGDTVRWLAERAGLVFLATHPDLSGIERVVVLKKSDPISPPPLFC